LLLCGPFADHVGKQVRRLIVHHIGGAVTLKTRPGHYLCDGPIGPEFANLQVYIAHLQPIALQPF